MKNRGRNKSSDSGAGAVRVPGLVATVVCLFVGIMATAVSSAPGPALEKTYYNVYFPRVTERMQPAEYIVKNLDIRDRDHYGETGKWKFCPDLVRRDQYGAEVKDAAGHVIVDDVQFDEGEMLLKLTLLEYGICKKVTYYRFLLDSTNKVLHEAPYELPNTVTEGALR